MSRLIFSCANTYKMLAVDFEVFETSDWPCLYIMLTAGFQKIEAPDDVD